MARRHLFDWNTFKMAAYLQDSRCGDSMWCAGSGYQKILSFVIENSIIVFLEKRLQLDLDIFSVPFTILLKNIKNCYAEFFHGDFWGTTKKCENKNLTYFFLFVRTGTLRVKIYRLKLYVLMTVKFSRGWNLIFWNCFHFYTAFLLTSI